MTVAANSAHTRLYHKYKYNARKRKIKWGLTKEQFFVITKERCHYCGKKPKNLIKDRWKKYECKYSGVDRKSSKRGYFVSNVVPCCSICNRMKGQMTVATFIASAKRVAGWRG